MNWHEVVVRRRARVATLGDPQQARELWLVAHGHGQLVADFLPAFDGLVSDHRAVVAPEALNHFYRVPEGHRGSNADMLVGATWMTREHRLAEIADYIDYLDAVVREFRAPSARLVVLGFSQGVSTVLRWLSATDARIDRIVCWAGEVPRDVDLAATRSRWPAAGVDLVVGRTDEFREWIAAPKQVDRFREAGIEARVTEFEGGHRLDRATLLALATR